MKQQHSKQRPETFLIQLNRTVAFIAITTVNSETVMLNASNNFIAHLNKVQFKKWLEAFSSTSYLKKIRRIQIFSQQKFSIHRWVETMVNEILFLVKY